MQLRIPQAPRPVSLAQVPGAFARVRVVAGAALAATLLVWWGGVAAARALWAEDAFLANAVEVRGRVAEVSLPELSERLGTPARLRVVYRLEGRDYAASGVSMDALAAEGLAMGAAVQLLVDPAAPTRPREVGEARAQARWVGPGRAVLGLGLLATLALAALELRRALRREVAPLRVGALVWLTPDVELPESRAEVRFPAHYYRADVRHAVVARGRPGRAPVRKGAQVLAAVAPAEPTWVRVIDEDLARALGWFG